ncbi:MAG: hypothetical protein ABI843_13055 [Dokdonella sp.]
MNSSLTLTLNQLASLIGSFAFPDPDGDDSIVHGPGGPRVRGGVLADIRRVTIAVIEWAERLGDQSMLSIRPEGDAPAGQSSTGDAAAKSRSAKDPAGVQDGCAPDDDCGSQTDGTKGKGPPGSAMAIIDPPIHSFVSDLSHGRSARLPLAAGPGPNPWKLPIGPEAQHAFGLLVAGAQFQFAVEATKFEELAKLFQASARKLIDQGLHRLHHEPRMATVGAV